jgi:hypothetical protein
VAGLSFPMDNNHELSLTPRWRCSSPATAAAGGSPGQRARPRRCTVVRCSRSRERECRGGKIQREGERVLRHRWGWLALEIQRGGESGRWNSVRGGDSGEIFVGAGNKERGWYLMGLDRWRGTFAECLEKHSTASFFAECHTKHSTKFPIFLFSFFVSITCSS